MADFIALSCPSCGGKLQITDDLDRFACGYCGNEMVVNRGGGIVSLKPITEGLKKIQAGTDHTASELAIARLDKEIHELRDRLKKLTAAREESEAEAMKLGLGSIAVLIFVLIMMEPGESGRTFCLAVPIVGLGLAVVMTVLANSKGRKQEIAKIETLLQQKQVQLRKHREIVAKY